ncbi:dispanin subfamily A member 2b-like isoform X2 [Danio rerio]|uniref:Dispanin subfamily A member 2b-like n=1 Tax=Danio rerio TaxID=7955 RepID=X1WCU7_DANRE|nr:dispanin subfamily A member 2b-like [Danio rerio]|eukprot:XP_001922296.1 dispanin subfamily A member 2b-like [Danio rerio]
MDPRLNSPEKSQFPPPPSYQDSPPPYTPSYPGQSVPQAPYVQGPHPRQAVVSVQPAVFVAAAPLQTPPPDYLCYSIFNLFCCCFPLGIAALIFSVSTWNANSTGQRELAEKNSKTARTLNNFGVGLGIVFIIMAIVLRVIIH